MENDVMNLDIVVHNPTLMELFGLPRHQTDGSAGVDLVACIEAPLVLEPGQVSLIPSGIAIHVKDPGYAAVLIPRSGMGHKHGIVLGNLVGLIDSDYTDEIKISCWNRGDKSFTVEPGMRIAQMVIIKIAQMNMRVIDAHTSTTRNGGFGSTGGMSGQSAPVTQV